MRGLFLTVLAAAAISACDRQEPPVAAQAAPDNWPPPNVERNFAPEQVARGEAVYAEHCLECHGPQGKGLGGDWRQRGADGKFPPPPLDDSAHAWHHPTRMMKMVIRDGSPGGSGNMPAWKDKLTEAQIDDVVVYIKTLWSDKVYAVWHDIERRSLEP